MRRISVLSFFLWSCATAGPPQPPRTPPALAPVSIGPAPVVPAPLPLDDPDFLAVLRVRKPLALLDHFGFSKEKLRALQIDPGDLHGETVVMAMLAPPPGKEEVPPFVALVPAAASSRLMEAMHRGGFEVSAAGADSVVSFGKAYAERAVAAAPALAELAKAPLEDDVSVQLEMKRLVTHYAGAMQRFESTLQQSTAAGKATQIAVLRWLYSALAGVDTATLAISVLPDAFDVTWVDRAAAPRNVDAPVPEPASLVRLLPPGTFRLVATGQALRKGAALMSDLQHVVGAAGAGAWANAATAWAHLAAGTTYAFSAQVSAEKIVQWSQVYVSDQPRRILDLARRPMASTNGGMACMPGEVKNTRSIAGWPVYEFEVSCKERAAMSAVGRQVLKRMYPFRIAAVQIGDYVVETGGYDAATLDGIAGALFDGRGQSAPLSAQSSLPQSGFFHADLDLASMANTFSAINAEAEKVSGGRPALLDARLPPIALSGYDDGLAGEYRARVPAALVTAIGRLLQQVAAAPARKR